MMVVMDIYIILGLGFRRHLCNASWHQFWGLASYTNIVPQYESKKEGAGAIPEAVCPSRLLNSDGL